MFYLIGSKMSHVLAIELHMYCPPMQDIVDPVPLEDRHAFLRNKSYCLLKENPDR